MSQETQAERIVAEAGQLINDIQKQLDDGEAFYREHGIERSALAKALGPKEEEEAARLLAEDLAGVEHEVQEARARQSFERPVTAGGRSAMRRTMI